jgi:hypothetical protein
MFVFWVVGQKIEAKCWVKNWTALLALICSPGSPQDILGAAGFNREREREKVEFWIQARVQGMISAPSRLQWFRGMCDLREPTALLSQICSHMIGATLEKML